MPKPMICYVTSAITVMGYSFTQEIRDGTDDSSESLCSGFVNSSCPLTVVMQSATAEILLITDSGTAGITKEALRYQRGAKSSYSASHFCKSLLVPKILPEPVTAPKPGNTAELILTSLS